MEDIRPYSGDKKGPSWIAKEQEANMREKLGNELYGKITFEIKSPKTKKSWVVCQGN